MPTVAIVGAGLIGRSWAIVFARAGWEVRITDPSRENLSIFTGCRDQLVELRVWPIEDHSLFDRLTRGRREVMTVLQLGPEHGTPQSESPWWPSPEAIASLQHTGKDCGHALENQPGGLEAESRFSTAGAVSETTVPR